MPSKDMSEILSRCRTGDSAAQEPLALQPIRALSQWRRLLLSAVSLQPITKSWKSTIVNRLATYLPIILLPEIEFRTMR